MRLARTLAALAALGACARTTSATTAPAWPHEPEIQRFEASDRIAIPAPGGIVFVGSSTLPDVITAAPRVVLPYKPRLVADSLHMTPVGYALWRAHLSPLVR